MTDLISRADALRVIYETIHASRHVTLGDKAVRAIEALPSRFPQTAAVREAEMLGTAFIRMDANGFAELLDPVTIKIAP
jgi:hypothetical protein